MARYRVTEAQLQKIFEDLEMKRLSEYDNYNYPAGADADPNAPWNQGDSNHKEGEYVPGNYTPVTSDRGEYLLKDKQSNQLYYTINDVWDNYENGNSDDIKDVLQDYLDIQQEEDADEDGRYMTNASDWKDYIDDSDILNALASYMNYQAKGNANLDVVDGEKWQDGEGKFLMVTPESIGEVMSEKLKAEAGKLLGLS
jgi:hypothetical protein